MMHLDKSSFNVNYYLNLDEEIEAQQHIISIYVFNHEILHTTSPIQINISHILLVAYVTTLGVVL
jgi:hypothetical protein